MPAGQRITQRICETIKGQIASGLLPPGAPLPSTRSLAAEWGVSRTTVTAAYEQLNAEGYLDSRQGARTRVAGTLAPAAPEPRRSDPAAAAVRLSAFARRLADGPRLPVADPGRLLVDFRYGDLAAGDFPRLAWRSAVTRALLRRQPRLRYADPAGAPELRAALHGYLWRARGMRCEPRQIVIVNGSQQGLDLCARLLLDPGDRAAIEDPGYHLARQVFAAVGAEIVPVPVDGDGLRADGLPAARLVYTTPSHQFPLGAVLSAGRRHELLAWARRTGAIVVEDDYDSEYRFDIAPIPPLQALDDAGRVVYLGTVSKTLSPTLRLGYLVVPPGLEDAFADAKRLCDRHTATLEQAALADLIESGAYERHVRRVRRANAERRGALLAALDCHLGNTVTLAGTEAGLHVVAWLNAVPAAAEAGFVANAATQGLGVYPIGPLYGGGPQGARPDRAGLVLGYAALAIDRIEAGVRLLAAQVRAHAG